MIIIMLVLLVIFFISCVWIWNCLGDIEKSNKIIFIVVGSILIFICTFLVFQISKSGVIYERKDFETDIRNTIVLMFTVINTLILLPYVARQFSKVKNEELKKEKFQNKMLFIIIIFLIFLVLECGYMKDMQQGILEVYQTYVRNEV